MEILPLNGDQRGKAETSLQAYILPQKDGPEVKKRLLGFFQYRGAQGANCYEAHQWYDLTYGGKEHRSISPAITQLHQTDKIFYANFSRPTTKRYNGRVYVYLKSYALPAPPKPPIIKIGDRIRIARERTGLSVVEVAFWTGLTVARLRRIEENEVRPRAEEAFVLGQYLGAQDDI